MKSTSEILERISNSSANHKEGVFNRLYRYLMREDIYYAAYQKLYANKGATTKGIDNDTSDGFGDKYVKNLIKDLKELTYKAKPVRREYIKKQNGKMRPLGIPSFRDKLLQEVIRQILESIYEPTFSKYSHGFRPGKSCHSALKQLECNFTGAIWFIEGDIKGCFDNIDHKKLIEILEIKIKDSKFINIIREFLKAGYIEDFKYNRTFSGTPQGGILSPILANIYLNELDKKVMKIKDEFDKLYNPKWTKEYSSAMKKCSTLKKKIQQAETETEKEQYIDNLRMIQRMKIQLPAKARINKKIAYVRYADDWLIGVCGDKSDSESIKAMIGEFLSDEMKLELSEEKTLITHSSNRVRFLGYNISVRRNNEIRKKSNGVKARTLNYKVELTIPFKDRIERFLFERGVIKQTENGKFKPIHRPYLLNLPDHEIVEKYNSEVRGICNFYRLACDYHLIKYFGFLMEYSCLKTLANKHKSSTKKIINNNRHGNTWGIDYITKTGKKTKYFVKTYDCKAGYNDNIPPAKFHSKLYSIQVRLNKKKCELCAKYESTNYEVHTVKSLKELSGKSEWEKLMLKKHRKTLILCEDCHNAIHR